MFGVQSEKVKYVPVSGLSGENIVATATDSRLCSWYKSSKNGTPPSLIEAIQSIPSIPRELEVPLRFMVTEVLAMTHSRALGTYAFVCRQVFKCASLS